MLQFRGRCDDVCTRCLQAKELNAALVEQLAKQYNLKASEVEEMHRQRLDALEKRLMEQLTVGAYNYVKNPTMRAIWRHATGAADSCTVYLLLQSIGKHIEDTMGAEALAKHWSRQQQEAVAAALDTNSDKRVQDVVCMCACVALCCKSGSACVCANRLT